MKKALIIIFSAGLLMTIGFGIAAYVEGKKLAQQPDHPMHYEKDYANQDAEIKKLDIKTQASDIKIKRGQHFNVKGEGGIKGKNSISSSVENGTLKVQEHYRQPTINFRFDGHKSSEVTITVPDRLLDEVVINNDTTDITIEDLKSESLRTQVDTGDLTLKTSHIDRIDTKSDAGDILIDRTEFKDLKLENDVGDSIIKGIKGDANIKAVTDTGDITVKYAQAPHNTKLENDSDEDTSSIDVYQPELKAKQYGKGTYTLQLQTDTGAIEVY